MLWLEPKTNMIGILCMLISYEVESESLVEFKRLVSYRKQEKAFSSEGRWAFCVLFHYYSKHY